ncbi:CapD protein, required for the biosynthesis of type 1 capsular polysaccharide [Carnobacterium maltaromaticum]|uniref:polysaccharide biosynthesis protein n=1 Tax=Carnobacterium maltaromaticum TaxID=2751 RepID=UPI000704D6F5|nr:nucleoside-diphosphate sugar epimerase/dehydratase [Carnobacterium maltaromaticum]KRN85858.1 CapD protein, required for the biosynthesis of type 1 capsular polysaccharide [Carnobacterium maltaromaticum]
MILTRNVKKIILISLDSLAIILSSIAAYIFLNPYIDPSNSFYIGVVGICLFSYMGLATYFKLFSKINRYTSLKEILNVFICVSLAFFSASLVSLLAINNISWRFLVLMYVFSLFIIAGSRIVWRILIEMRNKHLDGEQKVNKIRTLVVGAGEGGSVFIKSSRKNDNELKIIGIVDSDQTKQNTYLYEIPVIGLIEDIPELVHEYDIAQITIAIPSLKAIEYEYILDICNQSGVKFNLMPSVEDVLNGKLSVSRFRKIDVVDLLGREEVKLDMQQISKKLHGKTVLVSGAGGSIGSEICRQIMKFHPSKLILLGHGENSIYLIHKELGQIFGSDTEIIPVIADIQDRERIFEIMKEYRPDRVYHAAAHKHVPMMECNPKEAVKNNIYGTKNMAEAAKASDVGSFVMISTDKAVNPPNVMGATKRIAEMIVTGLNEPGKTKFAAVRFGNVLGSRGSVVPLFKEQIENGGPITVTDFRMTRYFMTIPEASRLVIQAGALAKGGEIFILDMGEPVKIVDLAKKVVKLSGYTEKEIAIIETGIRPGEKLYEELLVDGEKTNEKVYDKIFVGKVSSTSIKEVEQFIAELSRSDESKIRKDILNFTNAK